MLRARSGAPSMKELFTVMLVWDDERLSDVASRVEAEQLRLVLVRDGEPVAIMIPLGDREALEIGLWEKGAKEHLAKIFGDDPPVAAPEAFKTSELGDLPERVPTAEDYDLFETSALMKFELCPACGAWIGIDHHEKHRCGS